MSALEQAKYHIFSRVTAITGNDSLVDDIIIDYPPTPDMGDLSLACFVLAKLNHKSPVQMAQELAGQLKSDEIIAEVKAVGPYVNFTINPEWLLPKVIAEAHSKNYGANNSGNGAEVMIEYSNANTHKEYHIGHLRNIAYGDSVAKLLEANGYKVTKVSFINDFGIHVAKALWQLKQDPTKTYSGYDLGSLYATASQAIEKDEQAKLEVGQIMKNIEARTGEDYKLWQTTREWSIDYFAEVYKKLNISFDKFFYESDLIDEGRAEVVRLLEKGVLKKSEGAVIADLEEYSLGVLVFLRTDGTALYPVADLALAVKKFKSQNLQQSLYVVDKRQSLYFEQLFKVLELSGYTARMEHLSYDFVRLPEGAMSSRLGRVITFEDLYQEILAKIVEETKTRHADWKENDIIKASTALAIGVLKFEMIKVGASKIITFDTKEALRFDGFTSVYLQYAGARINSLMAKAKIKVKPDKVKTNLLTEAKEKFLLLEVAKFPAIVRTAGAENDPSVMAKYLFDLSRMFNDYYHSSQIIQDDKDLQNARLSLATSVLMVLTRGLELLGIAIVDKM
jgi:arginyl-tRNA synthetase